MLVLHLGPPSFLQECWEMMYDTVDTVYDCIRIATGVLSTLRLRPERMLKGESMNYMHGQGIGL